MGKTIDGLTTALALGAAVVVVAGWLRGEALVAQIALAVLAGLILGAQLLAPGRAARGEGREPPQGGDPDEAYERRMRGQWRD